MGENFFFFFNILYIFSLLDWARLNQLAGWIRPVGHMFDTLTYLLQQAWTERTRFFLLSYCNFERKVDPATSSKTHQNLRAP